jgi:hypothetical protein
MSTDFVAIGDLIADINDLGFGIRYTSGESGWVVDLTANEAWDSEVLETYTSPVFEDAMLAALTEAQSRL